MEEYQFLFTSESIDFKKLRQKLVTRLTGLEINNNKYVISNSMIKEMRGICIVCEFQVRGNTFEELDVNFTSHFETTGHETYFFMDGDKRIERSVS